MLNTPYISSAGVRTLDILGSACRGYLDIIRANEVKLRGYAHLAGHPVQLAGPHSCLCLRTTASGAAASRSQHTPFLG